MEKLYLFEADTLRQMLGDLRSHVAAYGPETDWAGMELVVKSLRDTESAIKAIELELAGRGVVVS